MLNEGNIVRDQIPVVLRDHCSKAALEEEIVSIQNADQRRRGNADRMIARGRGTAIDIEALDNQPSRSIIALLRNLNRVVGGCIIDDDDLRDFRLRQR